MILAGGSQRIALSVTPFDTLPSWLLSRLLLPLLLLLLLFVGVGGVLVVVVVVVVIVVAVLVVGPAVVGDCVAVSLVGRICTFVVL